MWSKLIVAGMAAGVTFLVAAAAASAHVTVQPDEAVVGSFSRFVVRVPNERDDASTTAVPWSCRHWRSSPSRIRPAGSGPWR